MGYEGQMGIFKFFKAQFSPQWRFFVHTLMHCISKKTTGWSQFSSTIVYALVCLSTTRKYNFSLMIFNDLLSNLDNKKSFFMYPRFVQAVITNELTDIPHFDEVYVPKPPKGKVFSNMRRSARASKKGEDSYTYLELMETIANINVDVVNQGKEIKALLQVVISQQGQISKLKQLIEGNNVEAKGEFVEERAEEKAEGVIETEIFVEAAEIGKAAVNKAEAAETTPAAVTTPAVETVTTAEPKGAA
ncbi:hypothetical protein L6452_19130 [Arctium lappa]|uniref:Uncharacterized protein n=1 Tax=Arctium lappa TaxID=4217 RepID=A0ACB9B7Q9_ARCLA|nr:hypothetical protein L6452_19130 [Arctium lappa]